MSNSFWNGVLGVLAALFIFVAVPYSAWKLSRWVNFELAYKTEVKETVRDMVKKECLK